MLVVRMFVLDESMQFCAKHAEAVSAPVHYGIGIIQLLLWKVFAKRPQRSPFSLFLYNDLRWLTEIDGMSVASA